MAKKGSSKGKQNTYAAYKTSLKWKTNREAKLKSLIAKHPNNTQLHTALKNLSSQTTPRRKTPKAPFWSHSMKEAAQLIKEFSGSCPHAIFSSNKAVATAAMQALGKSEDKPMKKGNNFISFSIKDRARIK